MLFGTTGFDATTTLEIAKEADVTEPLIYYHFKGKDELFTHSLELAFKGYFPRLRELPEHTATEFQKIIIPGYIWHIPVKQGKKRFNGVNNP